MYLTLYTDYILRTYVEIVKYGKIIKTLNESIREVQ